MEKETVKKNLTSGSESDEEERIVGSEALSTSSRELCDEVTALYYIQWTHQRQGTAEGEHRSSGVWDSYVPWYNKEKKKKEWMNLMNEL